MKLKNGLRWSLLAAAVGLIALGWASGLYEHLDAESVENAIRDAGPWGPVLYVGLFIALEPWGVPGIVFVVPGSLVWDWPTLFLLTWTGAVGAGLVGFTFARTIGRSYVEGHLSERARQYDERLAVSGLRTVIIIRLMFFIAPWAHWLLGLSKVRLRDFVLGTIIGLAPMLALFTWLGGGVVDWFAERPVVGTLVVVLLVAGMVLGARRFQRSVEPPT